MSWTAASILILHFLIGVAIYAAYRRNLLRSAGYVLIIVLAIPLFGPLSLLGIEWAARRKVVFWESWLTPGNRERFQSIDRDDDIREIVPLEEALVLNDVKVRREVVMNILQQDSSKYIDLLMKARMDKDMEVTHYATTMIMEIQRNYELAVQQTQKKLRDSRPDAVAYQEAAEAIKGYLDSGLLDEYPLRRMRERYDSLLARWTESYPNEPDILRAYVENKLAMGDYPAAWQQIELLVDQMPTDETGWLLWLRIATENGDVQQLKALAQKLRTSTVRWSAQGKELIRFWLGDDAKEPLQPMAAEEQP